MITISTVTPVYSGQDYLEELVNELERLRNRIREHTNELSLAESIFMIDGAIDESQQVLEELRKSRPWVKAIALSRNFGQHNATVAGILHCSGDWVVTLDEDLQHPPSNILQMLSAASREGADLVLANSADGSHGRGYRDVFSGLAKKLVKWVSRSEHSTSFSSFRLIRGQIARAAASVCSHQTYFDVALAWFTSRIVLEPMKLEDKRFTHNKSSGYSFLGLLSHLKRLIISSDVQFFRFSVLISGTSFLVAVVLESWVLLNYFFNPDVSDARGWASLMSVMLFYGGGISLLLGFILELVQSSMFHGQGKPTYFVVDRTSDTQLERALSAIPGKGE